MFAVPKITATAFVIAGLVSFATSAWLEELDGPAFADRPVADARSGAALPEPVQFRQASLQRSDYPAIHNR